MRANIFSCLLVFILGCNVTAATIHKIIEEDGHVFMQCPDSVGGKVTWSRESHGNKVDILTVDGSKDIRHNDPDKRYTTLGDKFLYIFRVNISDSGRYFCNNEAAMELTVIPVTVPPFATEKKTPATTSATTTAATTTTVTETEASSSLLQMGVRTVTVFLYLTIMISIVVTTWRKARLIEATHNRHRK